MTHAPVIDITNERRHVDDLTPALARRAGFTGVLVLVVGAILGYVFGADHFAEQFLRSYLASYCFFLSLALGGLFFVLLQHLTYAGWSVVVRRLAEVVACAMPLMAILALPIVMAVLLGWKYPFSWANADVVAHDALIQKKQAYLNAPFFLLRTIIYFAVWIRLASYFHAKSVEQDTTGDVELTRRMARVSAPGMLLFAVTITLFSFDYIMSLDPHWFSTIFGVYFFAGSAVGIFAVLIIMAYLLQREGRLENVITTEHYHDVGKFMFAFIVFWAYIAFSQYMLIWYANIPEETEWYHVRQTGGWERVSLALLFGHFFIPFLALISRHPKRRKNWLVAGAVWILLMHWIDIYWLTIPAAHDGAEPHASLHLLDATCLIGLGGLFVWSVAGRLAHQSLIPERDPRLAESLAFENQ